MHIIRCRAIMPHSHDSFSLALSTTQSSYPPSVDPADLGPFPPHLLPRPFFFIADDIQQLLSTSFNHAHVPPKAAWGVSFQEIFIIILKHWDLFRVLHLGWDWSSRCFQMLALDSSSLKIRKAFMLPYSAVCYFYLPDWRAYLAFTFGAI